MWNVLPRWKPIEQFRNRYEWLNGPLFRTFFNSPYTAVINAGLECAMQQYAEVKAITQGATSVIGSLIEACNRGLARNLADDTTLGKILYNVSPLEMTETEAQDAKDVLVSNGSFIIHLSEGLPNDAASGREFSMLKSRGLLIPGVSLIHGVALKASDFSDMAKASVGFVWSPRSNLELYGQTANVEAAKKNGVIMALAPDWSTTGSDGLLAELNFAATWNAGLEHPLFDDRTLVQMATTNAAKLVYLDKRLGSLQEGFLADVLVLHPTHLVQSNEDAFWAITHSTPEEVALVMIDGKPVYGDSAIMKQLTGIATTLESIEICGVQKSISFAEEFGDKHTFHETEAMLRAALRHWSRTLGPLSDCGV
ncbi:unnamed protein product [Rotaria sp. Silwood2]|nr:unnamed protein product [Rotaria sp. Silwood2]CAF2755617.1 unnamed protein product [Rotaria sp. Silwood2]CAF2938059.1 unnamed protein product [Rotaria sp. Silwood2]CAF4296342.1 unnamed protein product [Rotaria sp. Silwood2]CAF4299165.1 unnamed protein product [Rotaria sp. Silwood2]